MPTETWGENTADDYSAGSEDALMFESAPTTNIANNPDSAAGNEGADGNALRALTRMDVKTQLDVLGATEVTLAELTMTGGIENNTTDETIGLYRILRAWVELQVTWNVYSIGNSWTTGGADDTTNDRSASAEDSVIFTAPNIDYVFDITTMAENWRSGTWDQDGFVFINADEVNVDTRKNYDSPSGATDGDRPSLAITYTVAVGPTITHALIGR